MLVKLGKTAGNSVSGRLYLSIFIKGSWKLFFSADVASDALIIFIYFFFNSGPHSKLTHLFSIK